MVNSTVSEIKNAEETTINEILFWEHFGYAALHKGDWKLVKLDANVPWELYYPKEDRTEIHNLAAQFRDWVSVMQEEWNTMAQETDVFPN